MLFEGASRDGFRPLRPEISAKEPAAIATSATIRNARSAGIPKRRSARLIATKIRVSNKTVTEEPPGEKQIDYHEDSDQWVPRGDVLRCIIDDAGQNGEVTIHIDDQELSLAEFGRLLRVHAGWGMRIAFVPEEFISENPKVEIRKPKRRKR
jgi:hypothetical protein